MFRQMEWINLEVKYPIHGEIVLCCDIFNNFVSIGRYDEEEDNFMLMWIDDIEIDSQATHWMPLPAPPKE